MKRAHRIAPRLLVLAAALCVPGAARAELVVPAPAGWTEVKAGASEETLRSMPREVVDALRSGQVTAFAFDFGHTEGGFTPNYNVVPVDRPLRVRPSSVDEGAGAILEVLRKRLPSVRLVDKGILEVSGVNALQVVYDAEHGGLALRQMAVFVPGKPRSAIVTYTALRTQFDGLRKSFEAHAASITGADEQSLASAVLHGGSRGALVGAIAGALLAAAVVVWRKRAR